MSTQLDPVSVLVAILTIVIGKPLADILGPHAVVVIAASVGAAWALSRRNGAGRFSAALFFLRINFTALLLTVSAAETARHFGVPLEVRWLLSPIALLIGAIGDDWPALVRYLMERGGKFLDFWISLRTGGATRSLPNPGDEK